MTKEKLLPLAKVYFEHNKSIQYIYASEKGHFFLQEIYAAVHEKTSGEKYITITREDCIVRKVARKKVKNVVKEAPAEEVKEEVPVGKKVELQSKPKDKKEGK